MADKTGIEWTDATWNPVTGCTKVSAGCDHCYAETIARRFAGGPAYPNGFDVTLRAHKLDQPLRWTRPRRVFVNSMSDLFHQDIPESFILGVFGVMAQAEQHTFQVLTKRHARMRALLTRWADEVPWLAEPLPNVWLGVSVETQQWADIRIPALLDTPAAVRFISAEPLLGPIKLGAFVDESIARRDGGHDGLCDGANGGCFVPWCRCSCHHREYPTLDWVIVGGESGPGARPMHPAWARTLRDQCSAAGVPFLFKQWGEWTPTGRLGMPYPTHWVSARDGRVLTEDAALADGGSFVGMYRVGKKAAGRELDRRNHDEYPNREVQP